MLISLDCGCGASVNLETDQDERAWLFVERFSNAHVECGFISPFSNRDGDSRPIVVNRKRHPAIRILDDIMGDDDDDSGLI